jgi:Fe-S-cluster-containing hydrogenase component 2
LHPAEKKIVICDLCDGDPECVKVCQEGGWGVLKSVPRRDQSTSLYSRTPEETTRNLATKMYEEKAEEFL